MARPIKWREVRCLPKNSHFGPLGNGTSEGFVNMTVDEYETIRLIDYENLIQEECAQRMNIARTSVQRIYNVARKKVAIALVEGKTLIITGGEYRLYHKGDDMNCCPGRRRRNRFGSDK